MNESASLDELIDVLRCMLQINSKDPKWLKRNTEMTIQYEFLEDDGIHSYHCWSKGREWALGSGALKEEECDIILRVTSETLYRILKGELGGREAIVSGRLDMRKAPSMPMLLSMRAMFNRYTKAEARGISASAAEHRDT